MPSNLTRLRLLFLLFNFGFFYFEKKRFLIFINNCGFQAWTG